MNIATSTCCAASYPATLTEILDRNDHENKEDIILIWYDPRIGSTADTDETMKCLTKINGDIFCYIELDSCLRQIKSFHNDKVFLITSGAHASEILPHIVPLRQVDSIFIFCTKIHRYEHLVDKYPRIIGIYSSLNSLCTSIEEQIDLVAKQLEAFNVLDRHNHSIKDLSKQSAEFLWFQLFNIVVCHLPRSPDAKQHMLEKSRHYYRGNTKQEKLINKFEREYQPTEAINWYSKQSFIYKLVNKALRSEDIDLLYTFRLFIGDLSESLISQHEKLLQSGTKVLTVYRGTKFTNEEINNLQANLGKLISTNGYMSTSKSRSVALAFAKRTMKRSNIVPTLLEITCYVQQLGDSFNFADISLFCEYPDEQEVLFDLSATFRLDTVQFESKMCVIKMTASSEGRKITKDFIELTCQEIQESSVAIVFGKLLIQMGQYDKSQKYFERLLMDPQGEDMGWIEYNIGQAHDLKGEYTAAQNYYDRAYDRMVNSCPPRTKDSAHVLSSIGNILDAQGKYDKALEFHQKALTIYEKYYSLKHYTIAMSLNSIGNVFGNQERYNDALKSYQQALEIYEKCYPSGHPDIATCLNNIGLIHKTQNNYDKAIKLYKRALEIYQQHYPNSHPNIATNLGNIGTIYEHLNDHVAALEFHRRALKIYETYLPVGNVDRERAEQKVYQLIQLV